jgi:hypothetical protein
MSIRVRSSLVVLCLAALAAASPCFATSPLFVSAPNFPVGAGPTAVAVGDFNGDGIPDAVVTNYGHFGSSTISILLGTGKGGFKAAQTMSVSSGPSAIAAADLNGDGKLDLAITLSPIGGGGVMVLLGNGYGTFTPSKQGEIAITAAHSVATADFNRDGKLDLVVAGVNTLSVLLGNGDGTFQAPMSMAGGNSPTQLVTADFNNDGIADIAVTGYYDSAVFVLLGKGDGTFRPALKVPVGLYPTNLAAADFNHDGKIDMVVHSGYAVNVLLGNGDGSFKSPVAYLGLVYTPSFAVADLNGDGIPDIAVADNGGYDVVVLLGNGDGTFHSSPPNYAVGTTPVAIAASDFNRDGKIDLLTVDNGADTVTLLLNQDNRGFFAAPSYPVPFQPIWAAAGDFTGDGLVDIVVLTDVVNQLVVLPNSPAGFLAPIVTPLSFSPQFGTVVAGDLNGDGKSDVVVAYSGDLAIFLGNGDGTFQAPTTIALPAFVTDIVLADFNGDGILDMAVTEQELGPANEVQVMLGNGDGTFQSPRRFWAGPFPFALAAGDFNGDGKLDLAVVDQYSNVQGDNNVYVLLGNGDGTFQHFMKFPAGMSASALVVGDFNGDGKQDIVVGHYFFPRLEFLPGNGDGTFGAPQRVNVPDVADNLVAGDFNGDGKLDVAVGGGNIDVLLGNGDGTFQAAQTYATSGPDNLVTGQFSSSGALDLAGATNIGNVMILFSAASH